MSPRTMPLRVRLLLLTFALLQPLVALAQTFPAHAVTLICPWPPGGGADAQMRILAETTGKYLGQKVIIENRPGAVGTVGAGWLANAKPDGYTLSQLTNAVFRQPFIVKTPFDPEKDFTYIVGISGYNFGLVVRADSPWNTFQEFLDYAKANPGKVTFGTFGLGSPPHTVMDRVAAKHGIQWLHVPYKGTSEDLAALQGGHITASADGTGWGPFVDSGKFRLLATFGDKRLARWPNAPTLKELGYGIAEVSPWGIAGPKNMDAQVVKKLHDAFKKGMEDPVFLKMLDNLAQEPMYMTGEDYRKYALEAIPEQKAIVEKYNLKQQ